MGARGAEKKRLVGAVRQRILSDVITTRALYTPLVYVFSRGWSVTSTTVRFHLRAWSMGGKRKLKGCWELEGQHWKWAQTELQAHQDELLEIGFWKGASVLWHSGVQNPYQHPCPGGPSQSRDVSPWNRSTAQDTTCGSTGSDTQQTPWRFIWGCYGWLCTPYAP